MNIGKVVNNIPPSEKNGRNSEGSFYTLDNGNILFFYSRYSTSGGSDDSAADIAVIESKDRGKTWSDYKILFTSDEHNAINIMSESTLKMANGDIGLFYAIRMGANDIRLHLRRSSDQGKTFKKAVCCMPAPGYYVVNNDRVIRLKSGRILVPAAFHRKGYDTKNKNRGYNFDARGCALFFISDDDGVTWNELDVKVTMPYSRSRSGLQEPGVIQLKNGLIWMYARTDMGYQYESYSHDDGNTWTTAQPSVFTSPLSPLSIKRNNKDDSLVAIWNPIPDYNGRNYTQKSRTPFVIAMSKDEGKTWSDYKYVEDDPTRGYCYTAMHFVDDSILLGYCGGIVDKGQLNELTMKKIKLSELI